MKRQSLALAVLMIGLMQIYRILDLEQRDINIAELTMTLDQFIRSNHDLALQADFLFTVEDFLVKFCPDICKDLEISGLPLNRQVL